MKGNPAADLTPGPLAALGLDESDLGLAASLLWALSRHGSLNLTGITRYVNLTPTADRNAMLTRLVTAGLVIRTSVPRSKRNAPRADIYDLTPAGRAALATTPDRRRRSETPP